MKLNPEQSKAARSARAFTVCLAPPGSGKTATTVERIRHLAGLGEASETIALTYTNAAALEIQNRLDGLKIGYCGTLHGLLLRHLEEHGHLIGLRAPLTVIGDKFKRELLDTIVADRGIKVKKTELQRLARDIQLEPGSTNEEQVAFEYNRKCLAHGMIDLDSILAWGTKLQAVQPIRCHHLLLDEWQDASAADSACVGLISVRTVFIVGDPNQSIMSFRQGDPAIIRQAWTNAGKGRHTLIKSYRCRDKVASRANTLARREGLTGVQMEHAGTGGDVLALSFAEPQAELAAIARALNELTPEAANDTAILVRNNYQVERYSTDLEMLGCRTRRDNQTAQAPVAWEEFLTYLALTANPKNDLLAHQWIKLRDGQAKADGLRDRALAVATSINAELKIQHRPSAAQACASAANLGIYTEAAHAAFALLADMPVGATTKELLAECSYPHWKAQDGQGALVTTIHRAKGKEFERVILPGFEEGTIPSQPSIKSGQIAEERRLAYVALTRAARNVILTCVRERQGAYDRTPRAIQPSRFISEMGLTLDCR
jgi:DNA helicase-2/ATP-dependent DNA helicase PcrA